MKRLLLTLVAVVGLFILGLAAIVVPAFAGTRPIVDGAQIAPSVTQIKDGAGSLFVLADGTSAVLIDCGMEPTAASARAELGRHGMTADRVKAILLTHGHPDHVGGCAAFPKAEVMALGADVPYATGAEKPKSLAAKLMPDPGHYAKVSRRLHDREMFQIGGLSARVYAVPGHTPGSAAYLINNVLYVGDIAVGTRDGHVKGSPWFFSDDTDANKRSVVALAEALRSDHATVSTLAFSHSGPLAGLEPLAQFKP